MDLVKVKPGAGDDRFPVLFISGTQEIRRVLSRSCVAPSRISHSCLLPWSIFRLTTEKGIFKMLEKSCQKVLTKAIL